MDDISDVFGSSELLKAADLQGHMPTVIIESVEPREFKDGGKLVLSFQGKHKKLICNKTNARLISEMYGTKFREWVGCAITLYTARVDFQGKLVDAIRVRQPMKRNGAAVAKPAPRQEAPPEEGFDDEIPGWGDDARP